MHTCARACSLPGSEGSQPLWVGTLPVLCAGHPVTTSPATPRCRMEPGAASRVPHSRCFRPRASTRTLLLLSTDTQLSAARPALWASAPLSN